MNQCEWVNARRKINNKSLNYSERNWVKATSDFNWGISYVFSEVEKSMDSVYNALDSANPTILLSTGYSHIKRISDISDKYLKHLMDINK